MAGRSPSLKTEQLAMHGTGIHAAGGHCVRGLDRSAGRQPVIDL